MKNKTKDNKAITLIALVITIIIMLILASVTTYTGLNTYRISRINKFVAQMQLLQAKVDDLVNSKTTEELKNMGLQSVTTQEQINAITNAFKQDEITTADTSKYKVFTSDKILEILHVEYVENDIIVNFETREIVDVIGIEYEGVTYYTQYKLPGGQTIINGDNSISRDLSFNMETLIDGLNSTIKINNISISNGTLSYSETDSGTWQTVTNYTESSKQYDVLISKSGNYTFKLQDNTNSKNYIEKTMEIKLTNKPKTEMDIEAYNYALTSEYWAFTVDTNGDSYLWIPRFAYDENNNIKFVKGNSNITTDNTYIDNTWTIHNKFTTSEGIELTGLWVTVSSIKQSGLDMITLLNDNTITTLLEI